MHKLHTEGATPSKVAGWPRGSCVLRGEAECPDHRTDVAADTAEIFHPCVSRFPGPLLVVDA